MKAEIKSMSQEQVDVFLKSQRVGLLSLADAKSAYAIPLASAIDITAVPYFDNRHRDDVILNRIQDSIVSLPDAIHIINTELFRARRSRVVSQAVDTLQDTLNVLLGNRAEIFGNGPLEDDSIACHQPAVLGAGFRN